MGALAPTTPLPRAAWHRWARTRHPWQPPPPTGSQGVSQPTLAGSGPRQHPSASIFSRCAGCRRGYSLLDGNSCTMHRHMPTWPVMSFRAKFLLSPIFFSSSLVVLEGATASVPPNGCRNKCPPGGFAVQHSTCAYVQIGAMVMMVNPVIGAAPHFGEV